MQFTQEELIEIICKASTIPERLGDGFLFSEEQENNDIVNSRLEQWCQVAAQGNWDKFEKRLAWDSLNLSKVRGILGSVCLINEKHLPTWVETLKEGMKATALFNLESIPKGDSGENNFFDTQLPIPFKEVFLPFIDVAIQKLTTQTSSSYQLLSEAAHTSLVCSLLLRLNYLCAPAMELEFSVFRACHQPAVVRLFNKSPSNCSQEQYRNFIKDMLGGGLLSFFQKYPVLARLVATVTDLWVSATGEFLCRLASDWSQIQRTFSSETELGQVVAIQPSMSDYHNNGSSVLTVKFASGLKLVYKPKDLGLEQAYFQLLAWLNERNVSLPFKLLKVINCSTYGWVEFVEYLPCKDKEEARRYYQRAGMLMCLAYVLEGTDLHHENLIASGEHPVLVDLETLMHHRFAKVEAQEDDRGAIYLAYQQLKNSVLRTTLLPQWMSWETGRSYEVAGLGRNSEHETPIRGPQWNNINTDSMTLNYEYFKTKPGANVPSLEGVNLSPNDYTEEIIDGFRQMYWFLVEHRTTIQSPDSSFTEFAHQWVRFVFRPSYIYAFILNKTTHPKFLRDGADRSIQIDILSTGLLSSEEKPLFWSLLKVEQQALEQLDIPLFTARADSDALKITSNEVLEKCFMAPSYDCVIARLNQLNDKDLEQQIDFIRGSLYSLIAGEAHHSLGDQNKTLNFDAVDPLTQEAMVQQAIAIATDLQKRAILSANGSATWIAPQYIREGQKFQLQPLGYGLYDGCCGIALFLAALERATGGAGFRDLALAALQPLRELIQQPAPDKAVKAIGIGGIVGWDSIIYGLVRISQFLQEPALLEEAKQAASLITPELITANQQFDIMTGSAGTILGLLALHNVSAEPEFVARAITCGHHLLNNRVASNSGYRAWKDVNGTLLTGFSHGAAGIAYALLRLYQVTAEATFLEASLEAIAYESSVFIPEAGNWPDFRFPLLEKGSCMCSWCNGAPGIGLARVAGLDILDTAEIRQDIEAAVNTTKQLNLQSIDNLCCGNLGRVEFLFTAARKLSQPQLLEVAMAQAAQVVARAEQRGTFSYNPSLGYTPGFFQGVAGIGYELLRLAYPDQLPSVVFWE